jgi:hypothetical protein
MGAALLAGLSATLYFPLFALIAVQMSMTVVFMLEIAAGKRTHHAFRTYC